MFLNVLNQDMSNIISDSSNPLHPAAARLEPLHDQLDDARSEQLKFADWCQQKVETCLFLYWATGALCTCSVPFRRNPIRRNANPNPNPKP